MPKIELSKGMFAVIDKADLERISLFRWYYQPEGHWAVRQYFEGDKRKKVTLHREILDLKKGEYVIFINGNSLDCRRKNMEVVYKNPNRTNRELPV